MLKKIYNKLRLRFYKWNQRRFKPDSIPIYLKYHELDYSEQKFLDFLRGEIYD